MLVLLYPEHPLAAKKTLSLKIYKYTLNDDFSVMSMVENGFGISVMPDLILRNFTFNLSIKPLNPPTYRTIGIASLPMNNYNVHACQDHSSEIFSYELLS